MKATAKTPSQYRNASGRGNATDTASATCDTATAAASRARKRSESGDDENMTREWGCGRERGTRRARAGVCARGGVCAIRRRDERATTTTVVSSEQTQEPSSSRRQSDSLTDDETAVITHQVVEHDHVAKWSSTSHSPPQPLPPSSTMTSAPVPLAMESVDPRSEPAGSSSAPMDAKLHTSSTVILQTRNTCFSASTA